MALKVGTVHLEDYNPFWKEMYKEEEKQLKELLKDNVIEIMHVGSTSIEGLRSKPVIDIMITVKKLKDVESFKYLFTSDLSYDFKDDCGINGEYLVRKGSEDARTHFIHIVEENSERHHNFVYFKSYLESHPEKIIEYQTLKEELCKKYSNDRKSYTASKNDFIQNIINLYKKRKQ